MTLAERTLARVRPVLGGRWTDRIRGNLPSRKPQLWERPVLSLYRRAQIALRSRFDPEWEGRKVTVRLRDSDLAMEVTPGNRDIDLPLFQFGVYEMSGTRFVQAFLESGMTFIDVGANSGYYSLLASRMVGQAGHVYALEPVDGPFLKLQRNIELNRVKNVTALQLAVGSRIGCSQLYSSNVDRNDGLGSLVPGADREARGQEVALSTLEEITGALSGGSAHLVKIDVEGTELDVLAGGQALLSRSGAPALLFESFSVESVCRLLTAFGYDVRHVHFSLARGLEFPKVGEPFDNCFADYEPPNYAALKLSDGDQTFESLSTRSRHRIHPLLRLLSDLA